MKLYNTVKIAREKGRIAYLNGASLDENFYQYYTNKNGAISLMAQWDVGWKMAELEDKDPDKFKQLLKENEDVNKL